MIFGGEDVYVGDLFTRRGHGKHDDVIDAVLLHDGVWYDGTLWCRVYGPTSVDGDMWRWVCITLTPAQA